MEGEKDELKAYHDLDKNRRAIEYSLYSKECEEAQDELENVNQLFQTNCNILMTILD